MNGQNGEHRALGCFTTRKEALYPLNTTGLDGAAEPVWTVWRRREFCPCQDAIPFRPAHILVTIPTTLCRLILTNKSRVFVWREYIIFLIPNDCERQKGTSLSHTTSWQSGNALGLFWRGSRFETLSSGHWISYLRFS